MYLFFFEPIYLNKNQDLLQIFKQKGCQYLLSNYREINTKMEVPKMRQNSTLKILQKIKKKLMKWNKKINIVNQFIRCN